MVVITVVCFVATACPFLFGYGTLPLTNFAGEIVSLTGFGALLLVLARYGGFADPSTEAKYVFASLAMLLFAAVLQFFCYGQVNGMIWLTVSGYILAGCAAVWAGAAAQTGSFSRYWHKGMAIAILIGCGAASLASIAQYLSFDASWLVLSPAAESGRTFGFIRQPNHQATFLAIGLAALCCLQTQTSRITGRLIFIAFAPILVFGIISTGSRTGLVQLGFLSVAIAVFCWKNDCESWKGVYIAALTAGIWFLLYVLGQYGIFDFYGANKLAQTGSEGIGIRAAVWQQTWYLILERPFIGWGLPNFGSAFYLSGAAEKAGIVMTHSHNLFLQLAFAFGLPVTVLFCSTIAKVMWNVRKQTFTPVGFFYCATIVCLLIHSQIEFPLWYAYFLLPACYAVGWLVATPKYPSPDNVSAGPSTQGSHSKQRGSNPKGLAIGLGILMIGSAVWINHDYYQITPVFSPGLSGDLEQRLEQARNVTWLSQYPGYLTTLRKKVNATSYQEFLKSAGRQGCQLYEIWYQPSTIVALTYAGRVAEAKWIMYSYWRLSGGKVDQFKPPLQQSDASQAGQMLAFLESPHPVERSIATYDSICYPK